MTETAKLSRASEFLAFNFGEAVAVDGNTIVVGASYSAGATYVFVQPADG